MRVPHPNMCWEYPVWRTFPGGDIHVTSILHLLSSELLLKHCILGSQAFQICQAEATALEQLPLHEIHHCSSAPNELDVQRFEMVPSCRQCSLRRRLRWNHVLVQLSLESTSKHI